MSADVRGDDEFEDALGVLLRLARDSEPEDHAARTVNGWRRDRSVGWRDADLERCRHGFTAAQFCNTCDGQAS